MRRKLAIIECKNWAGASLLAVGVGSAAVHGSDITAYSVQKGAVYSQTSPAAAQPIAGNPYVFKASLFGDVSAVTDASLRLPSGLQQAFSISPTFDSLIVSGGAASLSALNNSYGNGNYTFTTDTQNDGPSTMTLALGVPSLPLAPHLSNFTAAQSINTDSDFALTWEPFVGATGNDHYEFDLIGSFGFTVFSDSGTGTTTTIPAGTLSAGEIGTGRLRFVHETQLDEASYPGAIGTAGFFAETQFTVKAAGSSGGGGSDTTPPLLSASSPQSGATNVAKASPVVFIFSEPMAASQSIQWSGNVNPGGFTYSWLGDQK